MESRIEFARSHISILLKIVRKHRSTVERSPIDR